MEEMRAELDAYVEESLFDDDAFGEHNPYSKRLESESSLSEFLNLLENLGA